MKKFLLFASLFALVGCQSVLEYSDDGNNEVKDVPVEESAEEQVSVEIPEGCKKWFNGCNTCYLKNDGTTFYCTHLRCEERGEPMCKEFFGNKKGKISDIQFDMGVAELFCVEQGGKMIDITDGGMDFNCVFLDGTSKDLVTIFYEPLKEDSSRPEIPNNCIRWFNGCNECSLERGVVVSCTTNTCPSGIKKEPRCIKFAKEGVVVEKQLMSELYQGNLIWEEYRDLEFVPREIKGNLDLIGVITPEGLTLPTIINGSLNLPDLKTAEGVVFPEKVRSWLNLEGLTTAKGLTLPESVGSGLTLSGLKTAEGLVLPKKADDIDLSGLVSAKGLTFPLTVDDIDLTSLTTVEGLVLPLKVGGDINLSALETAEGLKLPLYMYGDLNLQSLTTAKGITFPSVLHGHINLASLVTIEGLSLPASQESYVNLTSLSEIDRKQFKEKYSESRVICDPNPVCGANGRTYRNKCLSGNVEILHEGECTKDEGIPEGCTTWFDGCNNCMVGDNGALACTRKFCPPEAMQEPKCIKFKEVVEEKEIPEELRICTMEYAPVCGVDGKTYGNKCGAGEVEIEYEGECGD